MGTYAHYRLWIGIWDGDLDEANLGQFEDFFKEILDASEHVERDGEQFETMIMRQEVTGYGVQLVDLDWVTDDDQPEEVNLSLLRDLETRRQKIEKIFRDCGLPEHVPVKVYHHLDIE